MTKVVYRGREAAVAIELGRLLRYAKNGGKLAEARFREGIDYEVLKGRDLQDFWAILSQRERVYPQVSSLMILYTSSGFA